jgi:hypothetical protein
MFDPVEPGALKITAMNVPPLSDTVQPRACGLAIASLVFGIAGFAHPFISLAAIVTGHVARKLIRESNGAMGGRTVAFIGLILGYLSGYAGLFVLAPDRASNNANRIMSRAMACAVELAVNNFYTDYGSLPDVGDKVQTDTATGVRLLTILLGSEEESGTPQQNPRATKYLSVKETKTKVKGLLYDASGKSVVGLYDSWGNPFVVELDVDNDQCLRLKIGAGTVELKGKRVAVYSAGADKKLGTSDDVRSW